MTGGRLRPRNARDRDGGLLARLRCSGEQRVAGVGWRHWAQAAQTLLAQPLFHTLWSSFTTSLWMMNTPLRLGGPGQGRDGALAPPVGDAPGICQPVRPCPRRRQAGSPRSPEGRSSDPAARVKGQEPRARGALMWPRLPAGCAGRPHREAWSAPCSPCSHQPT